MTVEALCTNCKHEMRTANEFPCSTCRRNDKWETPTMSDILTSITSYAVATKADGKAFNQLRSVAAAIQTQGGTPGDQASDFLTECHVSEIRFMEKYFANDQKAKTVGKKEWKFRTYLPNAYSTSKGVLTKALKERVMIGTLGKTAIEKAVKAVAITPEKDTWEVLLVQVDNVRKALKSLEADKLEDGKRAVETMVANV